ncbi:G/U mismatch-specific DNA glycosylase [Actinopolymorpha sp. B17G11]|uniref:G/U mismatch-specific DNA glycosylase n=1 Tax=unclassified Actinopolymorpha TaxID=2627063 RepID=UPI0032D99CD8
MPRADLLAAAGKTIPDVTAPGLTVLFCGINPSLTSGATGWHFAHPGNRFWRALHDAELTPRQLRPAEQRELLDYGLGITNLVPRATAKASDVEPAELRAGARRLRRLVARQHPTWVAVVGVTAYRTAFDSPAAKVGPQDATLGAAQVWVLPNPSGLNAHYTPAGLAAEFTRLREAAMSGRPP